MPDPSFWLDAAEGFDDSDEESSVHALDRKLFQRSSPSGRG